jgi:hypothetical protein
MRRFGIIGALLVGALLLPTAVFAQAAIAGTVKDSSGAVLPGVTVEAASPVLIEKIRAVVSDATGKYTIENLRPGTYAVTFTLTGFKSVKRDNVTVTGSATSTVDASMDIGTVNETITVAGETPIVDITSTRQQAVLNQEAVQSLPTSRNYITLARLVPGTIGGTNDVGGQNTGGAGGGVQIHGSRAADQRVTVNGVSVMTLQAGFAGGGQPDVGSAAEITVDTASLSAELATGGPRINFIPKDGGNTFSSATFFTYANDSFQGHNFTSALQQAGLATPNKLAKTLDLNESVGGPIRRDKVWFVFSTRYNRANSFVPVFANLNAGKPDVWTYSPDLDRPAQNRAWVQQNTLRVTWQVTSKIKVAGTQKIDQWCWCPSGGNGTLLSATRSPEAALEFRFPRLRQEHAELTASLTNKLLLEGVAVHLFERFGNTEPKVSHGSLDNPLVEQTFPQMISVVEQNAFNGGAAGLRYRANNTYSNSKSQNYTYRVAASYVTGSHSFKTGWNDTFGSLSTRTYNFQPIEYRFANGIPNQLTQWATPFTAQTNMDHDFGMFAQDVWRVNRYTISGAIRYDRLKTSFPEQSIRAGLLYPNRNLNCGNTPSFCEQDNLDLKNLSYRSGFAWDVRGNGKTALKVAANKYLLGQALNGIATGPNPVNALVTAANRTWNDTTFPAGDPRRENFIPDCDLLNNAANGECGGASAPIGGTVPLARFDPDVLTGWGHRPSDWEFQVGVQQEIVPRVSVDVAYFRRIWQNFQVTDQVLNTDFTTRPTYQPFNVVVPATSANGVALPGAGSSLTYYDITPTQFGRTVNVSTLSDKIGDMSQHWQGVDVTLNGRLSNGLLFQAGYSTGRDTLDFCGVAAAAPAFLNLFGAAPGGPGLPPNGIYPQQFCHLQEPFLHQFKAYGSYTIPKVDVQLAVTYRDVPGYVLLDNPSGLRANFNATNTYLAANSDLGRTLASGAAPTNNVVLQIVNPDAVYLDRDRQLDLRIGKVVRWARTRSAINVDLFNALNRATILTANNSVASWQTPTSISNPRLLKVSFTVDLK